MTSCGGGYEVVVHAIPRKYCSGIRIARSRTARRHAVQAHIRRGKPRGRSCRSAKTGGYLKPAEAAWHYRGCAVLDGWDPEGNVVQFKQRDVRFQEISMPTIKAIETRLSVTDVKRSAAFYSDVFGLIVGILWPDDLPQFAILNRDGLRLQLGLSDSSCGRDRSHLESVEVGSARTSPPCTGRPSTSVARTSIVWISSSGTVSGSAERTIRSASFPGSIEPSFSSMPMA